MKPRLHPTKRLRSIALVLFAVTLSFPACSNYSLRPDAISGEDAFNRLKLAFDEINSANPIMVYIGAIFISRTNPQSVDPNLANTVALVTGQTSSTNWALSLVNRKKWYDKDEVETCVRSIKETGHTMNAALSATPVSQTNFTLLLTLFSTIPSAAAGTCHIKPLPDLYVIRTGTEGKPEQ